MYQKMLKTYVFVKTKVVSLFQELPCRYQMLLQRLTGSNEKGKFIAGSKLDYCPFGLRLKNGITNLQHCFIFDFII